MKEEIKKSLKDLSIKELRKLANLIDVGFLNEPEDKDEIILILSTESDGKIEKALKRLNKNS